MQTFKPNELDLAKLTDAAKLIKQGNAAQAKGKKDTEAGKHGVATWLLNERKLDIDKLAIGELVQIEGTCLIEIGKQSRFDLQAFQLAHPALFSEFTKDFSTVKFKPLV